MKNDHISISKRRALKHLIAAATLVVAGGAAADVSTNTKGPVQQGQSDGGTGNPALNNSAETISFSGAVSFATYIQSGVISLLSPGTTIVLHNGPNGSPVTYYSPSNSATSVQLASFNFNVADTGVGGTSLSSAPITQNLSALRLEWHQVGSVDGVSELVNDQVGYLGGISGTPIYTAGTRGPTSANAIFVNTNKYTTTGLNGTSFGLSLNGANTGYNTYDPTNYNLTTGKNLLGGVNRVQFAVAENSAEEVSFSGTPSVFATPNSAGYGKGNPNLAAGGAPANIGGVNGRQQLNDVSILNLDTTKIDPQTGTNYAAGAWNTGGTNNLRVEPIAVDAVTISANPGTGLQRLNRGDLQWLQTTSRLQNGATFNFAERDVNAGQRVVPAINSGIDPSWAVGINDGGNSNGTNATGQHSIGPDLRFSGKTTGTEIRTTIAQNRAAIGVVSISEARGALASAPIRSLDLDFTDQTDPLSGGLTDDSQFVRINYNNIASGQYQFFRNINVVTVKAPDAAWGTAAPNIKGDNQGDVRSFINNIKNTVSTYPSLSASIANPADGLLAGGYLLPSLMSKERDIDGGPLHDTGVDSDPTHKQLQTAVGQAYGVNFTTDGSNADNSSTIGTSATYGALGAEGTINGSVPITSKNYLLGNFNQNGIRDFSAVKESLNAALSLHHLDGASSSIFSGASNGTVVPSLSGGGGWSSGGANTKGDLIVLGDYNGDGAFDGKDVFALATGASLADGTGTASLTLVSGQSFADRVRDPNAVLRKNAALDYVSSTLAASTNTADVAFLRSSAAVQTSANPAFTPALAQANAFSRFDVNHDGVVDRIDAAVIDKFVGKNPASLVDQVNATVTANATLPADIANTSLTQVPINLYSVQQIDGGGAISHALVNGTSDFNQIFDQLNAGGKHVLLEGDANFNGRVDSTDYAVVTSDFGNRNAKWSQGDFNFNGRVDSTDYAETVTNFGQRADGASGSAVVASAARRATLTSPSVSPNASPAPAADRIVFDVDPNTGHVYLIANNAQLVSYEVSSQDTGYIANGNWQKLNLGLVLANNNADVGEGVPNGGAKFILENGTIDLGQLVAPGQTNAQYLQELGSGGFTAFSVIDTNGTSLFSADSNGTPGILVVAAVPEPATMAAAGMVVVALSRRRRR